jgi:hypothetical protein
MTTKQKAKEIFDAMLIHTQYAGYPFPAKSVIAAKNCASIAVDQILNCGNNHDGYITCDADYWKQVKKEIESIQPEARKKPDDLEWDVYE